MWGRGGMKRRQRGGHSICVVRDSSAVSCASSCCSPELCKKDQAAQLRPELKQSGGAGLAHTDSPELGT